MEETIRDLIGEVLTEVRATKAGMSEVRDKVSKLEAREEGRERELERRLSDMKAALEKAEAQAEKRLDEFKIAAERRLGQQEAEIAALKQVAATNSARWPIVAAVSMALLALIGSIVSASWNSSKPAARPPASAPAHP